MNSTQDNKLLERVFEDIHANIVRVLEGEINEKTPYKYSNMKPSDLADSLYQYRQQRAGHFQRLLCRSRRGQWRDIALHHRGLGRPGF